MTRWFLVLLAIPLVCLASISAQEKSTQRLQALFADYWQGWLRENPDMASIFGFAGFNDAWPDVSPKALDRRRVRRVQLLLKLKAIPIDALSKPDQLHATLMRQELETDLGGYDLGAHLFPITPLAGIQDISSVLDSLSFQKVKDYEDWLTRLHKFPHYMDQTIELLEEGIRRGRVQPRVAMKRVPAQVQRHLVETPEQSLFYRPFKRFPESVPEADRGVLAQKGKDAVGQHVLPAYRRLLDFLEQKYLPACHDGFGVWNLKDGKDLYAYQVRWHTTTALSPEEIHAIGLKEVKRLRADMDRIIAQVGFKGSFKDFVADLRSNPKFYYTKPEDLMAATRQVCQRVEAALPKLFGKLPRTPFLLDAVPASMAPDAPMGFYLWPSADGRRPGTYYVNLYRLEARPKYQIEALSLHEAVPGHHLQISLAFEQDRLPAFRRFNIGYNAFVEGWALYSESLGEQLGMYQDPYSKFGQLDFAIWRAVRLVVDTGMHAKQWTRDEAIRYAEENSAFSRHSIETEMDRYATWPAQALGYKIGELKIRELRTRAEARLKERFDLRAFHEVVLENGALPLDVLEGTVQAWLEGQGKRGRP